jgi:pyrroline-5-carboxylate reductase
MPNTPALVGAGVSGVFARPAVTAAQRKRVEAVLGAVGSVVWVGDEALLDPITAVSGSGPAYVFYFIEALRDAAIGMGLEARAANQLAIETFLGAARLARRGDEDVAVLRERVTSKGGTTEAALRVLVEERLAERFRRAVEAARRRSVELGATLGKDA